MKSKMTIACSDHGFSEEPLGVCMKCNDNAVMQKCYEIGRGGNCIHYRLLQLDSKDYLPRVWACTAGGTPYPTCAKVWQDCPLHKEK